MGKHAAAARPFATWEARPAPPTKHRKPRRIFLWFFLAVQAIFLAWLISAVNTSAGGGAEIDAATDAVASYIIITFWAAVDIVLGITYGIYRLARRPGDRGTVSGNGQPTGGSGNGGTPATQNGG